MKRGISVACPRCRTTWYEPASLTPAILREAGEMTAKQGPMSGIVFLRGTLGMELADAKAMVQHLSPRGTTCHRCGEELPDDVEVVCSSCRSFNYRW